MAARRSDPTQNQKDLAAVRDSVAHADSVRFERNRARALAQMNQPEKKPPQNPVVEIVVGVGRTYKKVADALRKSSK